MSNSVKIVSGPPPHDLSHETSKTVPPEGDAAATCKGVLRLMLVAGIAVGCILGLVLGLKSWDGPGGTDHRDGTYSTGDYCMTLDTSPTIFNETLFTELLAVDLGVAPSDIVRTNFSAHDGELFVVQCFYVTGFDDEADAQMIVNRLGLSSYAQVGTHYPVRGPPTSFNGTLIVTQPPAVVVETDAPTPMPTPPPIPGVTFDVKCGIRFSYNHRCEAGLAEGASGRCTCPAGEICANTECTPAVFTCGALPSVDAANACSLSNTTLLNELNETCKVKCITTEGCVGYRLAVAHVNADAACRLQFPKADGYVAFETPSLDRSQECLLPSASAKPPATLLVDAIHWVKANTTNTVRVRLSRELDHDVQVFLTIEQGVPNVVQLNTTNCTFYANSTIACVHQAPLNTTALVNATADPMANATNATETQADNATSGEEPTPIYSTSTFAEGIDISINPVVLDVVTLSFRVVDDQGEVDNKHPMLVKVVPATVDAYVELSAPPLHTFVGWFSAEGTMRVFNATTPVQLSLSGVSSEILQMEPPVLVLSDASPSQTFKLLGKAAGVVDVEFNILSGAVALPIPFSFSVFDLYANFTQRVFDITTSGTATQSSTDCATCGAEQLVRSNRSDVATTPQMTQVTPTVDTVPWVAVRFASRVPLVKVILHNNAANRERLRDITIAVVDSTTGTTLASSSTLNPANALLGPATLEYQLPSVAYGDTINITKDNSGSALADSILSVLSMDYVEIFAISRPDDASLTVRHASGDLPQGAVHNHINKMNITFEERGTSPDTLCNWGSSSPNCTTTLACPTNACNDNHTAPLLDAGVCQDVALLWVNSTAQWDNSTNATVVTNETIPLAMVISSDVLIMPERLAVHFGASHNKSTATVQFVANSVEQFYAQVAIQENGLLSMAFPFGLVGDAFRVSVEGALPSGLLASEVELFLFEHNVTMPSTIS